jgi:hypothetical protein
MSITSYDAELTAFADTYALALSSNIDHLQQAIAAAAEASLIGVGSGGSFTVASLLCNFHEKYTGRVSRPSTPLELICNPTLAAASPVFLISAEGKNPDILEALRRARRHSSRPLHVLTNRSDSPLIEEVKVQSEVKAHVFELSKKDGYLATNSLVLDATLVARAYSALNGGTGSFPNSVSELKIGTRPATEWIQDSREFGVNAASRQTLIVVFSPLLRSIAVDLESKLSEAALLNCQLADIRSFAHGRHLWLADRQDDCAVLAVIDKDLSSLWTAMREQFPPEIPVLDMTLATSEPEDLLAGLFGEMHFVSHLAKQIGKDPAKPTVPDFGRALYYLDVPTYIPAPADEIWNGERSKYEILGAQWPAAISSAPMKRAMDNFQSALSGQQFKALVFDYDGTLSSSQTREAPPSGRVVAHLRRLLDAGVTVGVASGRGGSVQDHLRDAIPEDQWSLVELGLYNGGWIGGLADTILPSQDTSEYLANVRRILGRLEVLGVPIEGVRETHPHQISVRFREGVSAEKMWFVIVDCMRQVGLDTSSIVRSKHSVDILSPGVNKSHLIAAMIQSRRIDPYEILTMGDQGAWPGNDSSLLEHRFSLSVDQPSRRIDRGWKLAPHHWRDVDATLWYLERAIIDSESHSFRMTLTDSKGGSS